MTEAGVLTTDDRVELLEGWLVSKMTHNPPHDGTVWIIMKRLMAVLPDEWIVRVQSSITLTDSEPEPDLVISRGPGERYLRSHPKPRDLAMVIEVADATLATDRALKARIYARARISVYWIVNLVDRSIEVQTQPKGGKAPGYRQRHVYRGKESVPLVIAEQTLTSIPVGDLLPGPAS